MNAVLKTITDGLPEGTTHVHASKPRYGSHPVERRRVSAGVFQYQVCA